MHILQTRHQLPLAGVGLHGLDMNSVKYRSNYFTYLCILITESMHHLNMRHNAMRFLHWLLINDQKPWCINMCLELREKANKDPTFIRISRIIKGDQSWIYSYDPETRQQLPQWKSPQSPRAKKAQQVQSSTKSIHIVFFFFWHEGDCSPWNCSSWHYNELFYCDVLRHLREHVQQ
jgi:hypothetical protein